MSIKELIERLEAATGPDRELDIAIYRYFEPIDLSRVDYTVELPPGFCDDDFSRALDPAPFYTSSVDAALMLVPERHWWELGKIQEADSMARHFGTTRTFMAKCGPYGERDHKGYSDNPAIALCICALKARGEG